MLFFRIYHLSAENYIGIWKVALYTQSLPLPQMLESQSVILYLDLHFMVKTKEKMAFFDSGGECVMQDKIMLKIFGAIIKNA